MGSAPSSRRTVPSPRVLESQRCARQRHSTWTTQRRLIISRPKLYHPAEGFMSVTPEPIMKIAMSFMAAKYLFAATEIGVFDVLARGPASLGELATSTGIPSRTLGIVAAAMVSLGLLEQDGRPYRKSKAAGCFLADIPGRLDLRPILRYFDEIVYPRWEKFAEAIRTDQGQPQFSKFTTHQQQMFSAAVEVFSAPGAVALA